MRAPRARVEASVTTERKESECAAAVRAMGLQTAARSAPSTSRAVVTARVTEHAIKKPGIVIALRDTAHPIARLLAPSLAQSFAVQTEGVMAGEAVLALASATRVSEERSATSVACWILFPVAATVSVRRRQAAAPAWRTKCQDTSEESAVRTVRTAGVPPLPAPSRAQLGSLDAPAPATGSATLLTRSARVTAMPHSASGTAMTAINVSMVTQVRNV